jgi:hypothetical protein
MHNKHWNFCTILARVENLEQKKAESLDVALLSKHLHAFKWEKQTGMKISRQINSSTMKTLYHYRAVSW